MTPETLPPRASRLHDRQRIADLEFQLQSLSSTAAAALDRVSELEVALRRSASTATRSTSMNSFDSVDSMERIERIDKLESALAAINSARQNLTSPKFYRYI